MLKIEDLSEIIPDHAELATVRRFTCRWYDRGYAVDIDRHRYAESNDLEKNEAVKKLWHAISLEWRHGPDPQCAHCDAVAQYQMGNDAHRETETTHLQVFGGNFACETHRPHHYMNFFRRLESVPEPGILSEEHKRRVFARAETQIPNVIAALRETHNEWALPLYWSWPDSDQMDVQFWSDWIVEGRPPDRLGRTFPRPNVLRARPAACGCTEVLVQEIARTEHIFQSMPTSVTYQDVWAVVEHVPGLCRGAQPSPEWQPTHDDHNRHDIEAPLEPDVLFDPGAAARQERHVQIVLGRLDLRDHSREHIPAAQNAAAHAFRRGLDLDRTVACIRAALNDAQWLGAELGIAMIQRIDAAAHEAELQMERDRVGLTPRELLEAADELAVQMERARAGAPTTLTPQELREEIERMSIEQTGRSIQERMREIEFRRDGDSVTVTSTQRYRDIE